MWYPITRYSLEVCHSERRRKHAKCAAVESKNPMPAAVGSGLDGNSLNEPRENAQRGRRNSPADEGSPSTSSGQAFDCMSASRGEAETPHRMTAFDE
jgi:hypothetical protein